MAAWIAAGSAGLLAHPLRHALAWLGLAVVLIAGWPKQFRTWRERAILAAAVVFALVLTVPAAAAYNVFAVAVVLAVLAQARSGLDRRALLITAVAVTVLGVFRLACASIAAAWLLADWAGQALGGVASAIAGKPIWVGTTFGGLDFLVLMAALYVGWLGFTAPPRWGRAACAAAAVLVGHLGYLMLLACSPDLAAALPVPQRPPEPSIYVPPPWFLSDALRTLVPWNLPVLAALIHAVIAACMFRWAKWLPPGENASSLQRPDAVAAKSGLRTAVEWAPLALALAIPMVTTLSAVNGDLSGRKIVAYQHGSLNWDKPEHDKFGKAAAGLYGMLPTLVGCLGAEFTRSEDLAQKDLADADVLVLIHPTGSWPEDRLQRVWDFVRSGGSLLVVAEPRALEGGQTSAFDEVLAPTAIRVCFDTAIAAAAHWQHSLDWIVHPVTHGLGDQANRFALAESASLAVRWPARPLLVGRWGWSDPGSDAVLTGQYRFDPGERLGDLVLAAEQRIGQGTVIVLGDAFALTNTGRPIGYEFTGRLLGYLASRTSGPQAWWRQALGLVGCVLLVGLLAWPLEPGRLAATVVLLATALAFSTAGYWGSRVFPDSRGTSPNCVACIDASHLDAFSGLPWLETGLAGLHLADVPEDDPRLKRLQWDDGIAGLELNLMRNGCLPIRIGELTHEQLKRAGMLISIAPSRDYSAGEQKAVRAFLERGGIWICTAGADRAGPMNRILAGFGLSVPPSHLPMGAKGVEPTPIGHRWTPYLNLEKYRAYVIFDSAWPIRCSAENAEVLARGDGDVPIVVSVRVGEGAIVLIGDGGFATNKNLENDAGLVVDGVRENAAFWRWLIARLRDRQDWVPPELPPPKSEADDEAGGKAVQAEKTQARKLPPNASKTAPKPAPGKEVRP